MKKGKKFEHKQECDSCKTKSCYRHCNEYSECRGKHKKKENWFMEIKKCNFCDNIIYKSDKPKQFHLIKTCFNKECKLKLHRISANKYSLKLRILIPRKNCAYCQKEYQPYKVTGKVCSDNCAKKLYDLNNKDSKKSRNREYWQRKKVEDPDYLKRLWKNKYQKRKSYYLIYNKKVYEKFKDKYRQIENKRREKLGLPLVSHNYKREVELIKRISQLFPQEKMKIHDRRTFKGVELDIHIPNKKLVVEHQGVQHFKEVPYFKSNSLKNNQAKDELRRKLCIQNNIKLIEINYNDIISTNFIINKLKEVGIDA